MSPFLQLAFVLSVILFSAKLAGYLSIKSGQPSVLGELLVGLLLGPSLINLTHLNFITDNHVQEIVVELGELGVLLLMFLAGLELHISDLARNTRVSALSGILGVVFPVLMGIGLGELNSLDFNHSVFLGLTLGATSVSISAQTLMELGVLRSRVGLGLLGAAVFDDVLVILLLSLFLAVEGSTGGITQVLLVFMRMIIFLVLSAAFGLWVLPGLVRRYSHLPISQGLLTLAIVIMMAYGLVAELVGNMAAITGTFLAGLFFARTPEKDQFAGGLHALAYSFFVPIFFVSIGLTISIRDLNLSALWLFLMIIMVAITGKILGAGLGARLSSYSWREAAQIGAGMVSRGEVGLIVAKVGLDQGMLSPEIFSSIVGTVLVTTLVTPPLLKSLFPSKNILTPVKKKSITDM